MSKQYDEYLLKHNAAVMRGFRWIEENLPGLLINKENWDYRSQFLEHDSSKFTNEEYAAYDAYFYGERTPEVEKAFDYAWLNHIHHNKHHWQHWVLRTDEDGTKALEMPYNYILEMICDWWAFSWVKGDLFEIFDWYESHWLMMILGRETELIIKDILWQIREKLIEKGTINPREVNDNAHPLV